MSLPVIATPEHTIKLWSLPQPVTFRPYLVKEEKLLLMAQAGKDAKEIENAVRQIIRNCTNGTVNTTTLPFFDLEYMFLQLRGKSVNSVIETKFECQNIVRLSPKNADGTDSPDVPKGTRCGTLVDVVINIDDIKLVVPPGHTNRVMLSDKLGVILRYPTAEVVPTTKAEVFDVLGACLDQLFDETTGQVWEFKEQTKEEITAFVDNLSLAQLDAMKVFFETMPTVEYPFKFTCPKCGYAEDVVIAGLEDFFG